LAYFLKEYIRDTEIRGRNGEMVLRYRKEIKWLIIALIELWG